MLELIEENACILYKTAQTQKPKEKEEDNDRCKTSRHFCFHPGGTGRRSEPVGQASTSPALGAESINLFKLDHTSSNFNVLKLLLPFVTLCPPPYPLLVAHIAILSTPLDALMWVPYVYPPSARVIARFFLLLTIIDDIIDGKIYRKLD